MKTILTHRTLLLFILLIGSTSLFAQKESGLKESAPVKQQSSTNFSDAEKETIKKNAELKEQKAKESAIYQKYLGVFSPYDPEYADKKTKLFNEDRESYDQMKRELQEVQKHEPVVIEIKEITRSEYENLPVEQKRRIDAHPERFKIID